MTILALIVVLGVLIFVHELGHFWAAKLVDIKVERFSIGLGPKVAGFQRGETEYILAAIPLGGYVKMAGMADEVMETVEGGPTVEGAVEEEQEAGVSGTVRPSPRDFDGKPIWARTFVISAGVIMNFLFAFLAFGFIAGFFGEPELDTRRLGTVVTENLPFGAERLSELPVGSEIVQVGGAAIRRWGDIAEALRTEPAGPLEIRTENPASIVEINLPERQDARRRIAGSLGYWIPSEIGAIEPGSPAERAGLRTGDLVRSVQGVPVSTWDELVGQVRGRAELETEVSFEREGEALVRTVTPEVTEDADPATGETVTYGRIGVFLPLDAVPTIYERVGTRAAVGIAWDRTVFVTAAIGGFLRDLVTRRESPRNLGSIVAIGEMSGDAAERGLVPFLEFMALFSINLAILNLLPIPILDGGHLLFLLVEGVRGRAVSIESRARWSQVGLVILMGIMIYALSNDFRRVLSRFL